MDFKLVLQREAILDVRDAFFWYEEQRNGLGYSFLEELENIFSKLRRNPLLYGLHNKHLRKVKLRGFPYLVLFEVYEGQVFIGAIRHTSRKPKH